MRLLHKARAPKSPKGQLIEIGDSKLGVLDLGRDVSRKVRRLIESNILTHGEPFRSGGVLGPACLPVLGGGSAAVSSLFAGNIFLATANPSTLMPIAGGVGSAVMGPGGIVAQAPFIAAGTAILPVVLPVMFFLVVSSMMMSARFDRLQRSLDTLAAAVREQLKRDLAEDYGLALSAIARLQDVSAEFDESKRFTDEMKIRLALVERDLSSLYHKYDILTDGGIDTRVSANVAPVNQHLYALSGIASVYVDRLRLKLALQDNPDDVTRSVRVLNSKVSETYGRFIKLLKDNPMVRYQKQMEHTLGEFNWWQKMVSRRAESKEVQSRIADTTRVRADDLTLVLTSIQSWSDSLDQEDIGLQQSVVYYRENDGKGELKAYYTSDLQMAQSAAT